VPDIGGMLRDAPAGQTRPVGVGIAARSLSHSYPGPGGPVPVLHEVSFDVPEGGYCSLVGPSGAGKTTLLALVGGLEPVQSGVLAVGNSHLAGLGGDRLAAYRRLTVGFVFQHFGLLEALTAVENVELAATLAGERPSARRAAALDLLAAVGMDHRASHRPAALSGGERQRVAIARALVNRPRLVLADEPTGNLDEAASADVVRLLEAAHSERGCTLVLVTHNDRIARRAPVRLRVDGGRICPS
jgi:putative ABC transport system ATP-binding protein